MNVVAASLLWCPDRTLEQSWVVTIKFHGTAFHVWAPHPSLGFLISHAPACASAPAVSDLCRGPLCQAAVTSRGPAGPLCLRCCDALPAALQTVNWCPLPSFLPARGTGVPSHLDQSDGKIWCPGLRFTCLLTGEGTAFFCFTPLILQIICPLCLRVCYLCVMWTVTLSL